MQTIKNIVDCTIIKMQLRTDVFFSWIITIKGSLTIPFFPLALFIALWKSHKGTAFVYLIPKFFSSGTDSKPHQSLGRDSYHMHYEVLMPSCPSILVKIFMSLLIYCWISTFLIDAVLLSTNESCSFLSNLTMNLFSDDITLNPSTIFSSTVLFKISILFNECWTLEF